VQRAEGRRTALNDRGVALLIALLVTTLLMTLIVEFAYATRVSLRAAVNFRDSQRAYFLARSGVNFAGKILAENLKNGKPQDNLEQREMLPVPFVSGGDVNLVVLWEDEAGKINIGAPLYNANLGWFRELLTNTGVSQEIVDKIKDAHNNQIRLPGQLQQVTSNEEYGKVQKYLTTYSSGAINVNTASETVLRSVLTGKTASADFILMKRKDKPIPGADLVGTDINTSRYTTTSDTFRVTSYATVGGVGGYMKVAEAVITRTSTGFTVQYWKIL